MNTFVPGTTILSSAVNQNFNDMATTGLSNCLTADGQQTWGANQKCGNFGLTGMVAASASGQAVEYSQWQFSAVPIGAMLDFAGTVAPSQWYFCAGQAFSRTTYSALFAKISTNYGIGDGVSTFNLPDFRGRVAAGLDNMNGTAAGRIGTVVTDSGTIVGATMGSSGGSSTHVQASGELATHLHTASGSGNVTDPGHIHNLNIGNTGGSGAAQLVTNNAGTASNIVNSATTGITVPSLNITVANAGSSTAMAWLQPTLIATKIIFAGA